MLAGEPSVSGDVATTTTTTATTTVKVASREAQNESREAAGIFESSNSAEDNKSRVLDEAERAFGGNRWPRQETLALLKIRSDMDVVFRDASIKGPLWEEVSRKLGELGYNRSAKKCKEKFENVFKYHKRTKDGRSSKGQGKTYRFFDELEAFQHHHPSLQSPSPSPSPKPQAPVATATTAVSLVMPAANPPITTGPSPTTHITSTTTIPSFIPSTTNPTKNLPPPQATNCPAQSNIPSSFHNMSTDLLSNSTSSSTSSDLELEGRRKRKRKWGDFFERLMKEVVDKQEVLQKKFLEAIEKRERERMVREEAWRMQEMTRINREREILAQERSIAAAKDAAVMSFLQKLAEQQNPGSGGQVITISNNFPPPGLPQQTSAPAPEPVQSQPPPQPLPSAPQQPQLVFSVETIKTDNGEVNNYMGPSSSRWPKVEVEALIKMRTNLDSKYHENGPKGPLWEEISAGMRRLGYNRNAKRCKEKWENINKYFKKVKESNKQRPEDSKTCPYFHQLDALYKEKTKHETSAATNQLFKPENSVPLMVRPEQQWPPQQDEAMEDIESDQNVDEDDKDGDDDDDDDDEDEDDGGDFEIVPNKQMNSMDANE